MAKLKLTYFDIRGRGEPVRLALSISNIPFEDERIPFSDWPNRKKATPFGELPILEVGGHIVAQSNAILRYVGKLTDLYPSDPWQAALCDETMEAVEDIITKIPSRFLPEEQKKAERKALVEGPLPFCLSRLEKRLQAHGGQYFADNQLTVADLKVFEMTWNLRCGAIDYVPTDLPDRFAPKLIEHYARVKNDPRVNAYYSKRGLTISAPGT